MRVYNCSFDVANLSDKKFLVLPNSEFAIGIKFTNNNEEIKDAITITDNNGNVFKSEKIESWYYLGDDDDGEPDKQYEYFACYIKNGFQFFKISSGNEDITFIVKCGTMSQTVKIFCNIVEDATVNEVDNIDGKIKLTSEYAYWNYNEETDEAVLDKTETHSEFSGLGIKLAYGKVYSEDYDEMIDDYKGVWYSNYIGELMLDVSGEDVYFEQFYAGYASIANLDTNNLTMDKLNCDSATVTNLTCSNKIQCKNVYSSKDITGIKIKAANSWGWDDSKYPSIELYSDTQNEPLITCRRGKNYTGPSETYTLKLTTVTIDGKQYKLFAYEVPS